jgi:hypothetical protein
MAAMNGGAYFKMSELCVGKAPRLPLSVPVSEEARRAVFVTRCVSMTRPPVRGSKEYVCSGSIRARNAAKLNAMISALTKTQGNKRQRENRGVVVFIYLFDSYTDAGVAHAELL